MFTKLLISYYRGEKIKLGITDRIVIKKRNNVSRETLYKCKNVI